MKRTVFSTAHLLLVASGVLFAVSGATADTADFDDLTLSPGTYWNGPDPGGVDVPDPWGAPLSIKVGSFQSGNIAFVNRHNQNYGSWDGFAYSNTTDTTTADYTNYSAYTGSGYGPGDDNYALAYGHVEGLDPSDTAQLQLLPYIELPAGASIGSAYITNSTYAALSMRDGDDYTKQFGGASGDDPDWFKLSAYGTDAAGTPLAGSVDFYLADYRFVDNGLDYIVDEWTLVDLSPLAGAKRVYFNSTSSDVGEFGMNTPGYFAIDNIEFATVPEPGTLALLLTACMAYFGCTTRRNRKS